MGQSTMTEGRSAIREWRDEHGRLHREDGPAIEYPSGSKSWYQNGKLHRTDGPARQFANGEAEWYRNGLQVEPPGRNLRKTRSPRR